MGYFVSKLIGVKVISELKPSLRNKLVLGLILFSELAWVLFGVVGEPYNVIIVFFAALPLGMVWGIVFSYLEGRKLTELLAVGLCISGVLASGILKSITRIIDQTTAIPTFWVPAAIGAIFLPLFLFFVWMLEQIPSPTQSDKTERVERTAMDNTSKFNLLKSTGILVPMLAILYAVSGILRDFRDNFGVEILNSIGLGSDLSLFARTETVIAIICITLVGLIFLVKNHFSALFLVFGIMGIGLLMLSGAYFLFNREMIGGENWYLLVGLGAYLIFVPFQTVVFERLIAALSLKGNAGFIMYIADSSAYLGSVILIVIKEGGFQVIEPVEIFHIACQWAGLLGGFALLGSIITLSVFYKKVISKPIPKLQTS